MKGIIYLRFQLLVVLIIKQKNTYPTDYTKCIPAKDGKDTDKVFGDLLRRFVISFRPRMFLSINNDEKRKTSRIVCGWKLQGNEKKLF